jgi:hypothetical protein
MQSVKKEFNFETRKGFPKKNLLYDRQEKTTAEYDGVYNDDFDHSAAQVPVDMMSQHRGNDEIAFWYKYEADHLFEAYENGQLKGKLKEVAAKLKEEDNPVIMLVKHKSKSP